MIVEVVVGVIEDAIFGDSCDPTFTIFGVIVWVHIYYVHRAVTRTFHFNLRVIGTLLGLF